jgi:Ca-activated chloride channel family protein
MNTKKLTVVASLIAVVLSACGGGPLAPAAPQASRIEAPAAPAAAEPAQSGSTNRSGRAAAATAAPAAAAAPAEAPAAPPAPRPLNEQQPVAQDSTGPRPIAGDRVAAEPTSVAIQPTPVAETYKDYGVNPWVRTDRDPLSTFALDVDTASYSVMRRYINDGSLPPFESVRAEEYINYFQQDYPLPSRESNFAVYVDGAPSPFHTDGSYLLRVGVQGYAVPASERKAANLAIVVDESGSMADGNRIQLVKDSLTYLVNNLRPDDTVSLIAFSNDARVVLNPTSARNRRIILNAINGLQPTNGTNTQSGLYLAYQMLNDNFRGDAVNRVILATDGVANQGVTDPEQILNSMGNYYRQDIYLTAVGFGRGNFNDDFLQRLASKGDGTYSYVDSLDEAYKVFGENITAALQPIAKDAKTQVDFNADVVAEYRLIGYEEAAVADQDFRNDVVDAGELNAGHNVTAIYAIKLRPNVRGKIATVYLRWQDVGNVGSAGPVKEISGDVFTTDLSPSFEATSARYQMNIVVAEFAEMLRQSPYTTMTMSALTRYANNVARALPNDTDVQEFAQLVQRASGINR